VPKPTKRAIPDHIDASVVQKTTEMCPYAGHGAVGILVRAVDTDPLHISQHGPSFLGPPDERSECPGGRTGALARLADGPRILSCLLDMSGGSGRAVRIARSADTIVRLSGPSRATTYGQLVRLRRFGYSQEMTCEHYGLSIGERQPEIFLTRTRGLWRRPRDANQGDDTASTSA
jgi:hypothetical protein